MLESPYLRRWLPRWWSEGFPNHVRAEFLHIEWHLHLSVKSASTGSSRHHQRLGSHVGSLFLVHPWQRRLMGRAPWEVGASSYVTSSTSFFSLCWEIILADLVSSGEYSRTSVSAGTVCRTHRDVFFLCLCKGRVIAVTASSLPLPPTSQIRQLRRAAGLCAPRSRVVARSC